MKINGTPECYSELYRLQMHYDPLGTLELFMVILGDMLDNFALRKETAILMT